MLHPTTSCIRHLSRLSFLTTFRCIRHYYFFLCMSFLTTKCHFRSCTSFLITKAGTTVRCIRHLSCMSFLTTKDSMIFSVLGNAGRVVFAKRKGRVGCSAQASKIYSGKNLLHKYLSGNTCFFTSTGSTPRYVLFSLDFQLETTSDSICVWA